MCTQSKIQNIFDPDVSGVVHVAAAAAVDAATTARDAQCEFSHPETLDGSRSLATENRLQMK
jgi:hypothetical protein